MGLGPDAYIYIYIYIWGVTGGQEPLPQTAEALAADEGGDASCRAALESFPGQSSAQAAADGHADNNINNKYAYSSVSDNCLFTYQISIVATFKHVGHKSGH